MTVLEKITPCLWFDTEAEEAARFYTSIFPNSRIGHISRYPDAGKEVHGKPEGAVLTVEFELDGVAFTALNGGPQFQFNEAVSFQVGCDTQEEVDYYWEKLGAGGGGEDGPCGWVKDRYGLSWQIVPRVAIEMFQDPDRRKAERAFSAMMGMKKLDIEALKRAHAG
jgi:predicted 3-demethylubiquinone-9 3-methyltransferase (glyoxalase superfamily)